VKRATADRALRDFLGRVAEVNRKPFYLGKVVAVVLFGSMLKPEVDLLSDVDVAVEIVPKEADAERARAKNERRARDLERLGYHFRGFLDRQVCWHREVFQHLKGRSRVISLADLRQEGEFILAVPHLILYNERGWKPYVPPPTVALPSSSPKPDDCPF
jgi:predicted nucleotidyltransferase